MFHVKHFLFFIKKCLQKKYKKVNVWLRFIMFFGGVSRETIRKPNFAGKRIVRALYGACFEMAKSGESYFK